MMLSNRIRQEPAERNAKSPRQYGENPGTLITNRSANIPFTAKLLDVFNSTDGQYWEESHDHDPRRFGSPCTRRPCCDRCSLGCCRDLPSLVRAVPGAQGMAVRAALSKAPGRARATTGALPRRRFFASSNSLRSETAQRGITSPARPQVVATCGIEGTSPMPPMVPMPVTSSSPRNPTRCGRTTADGIWELSAGLAHRVIADGETGREGRPDRSIAGRHGRGGLVPWMRYAVWPR
jgi:hypothetical protein